MYFPVANIDIFPAIPVAAAFAISLFCSTAGISGAFLLLPFQVGVLGYTTPGVSATNQIFNILACPAGVWRYAREGRLLVPLAIFIAAGTLPGVFIGACIRLTALSDVRHFLLFVSAVLFYIGGRMIFGKQGAKSADNARTATCQVVASSIRGVIFSYDNANYEVSGKKITLLSLGVGLIGGIYGVGGGAIMAPFLVSFFGLPVRAISGATLFATFITSIGGVFFYSLLAWAWDYPYASPDWGLGLLLGIGGIAGMYSGASIQKYLPAGILRFIIIFVIFTVALIFLLKFAA